MTVPRDKKNFMMVLEYDGTHYHGWQRQLGVMTIQEVVESKVEIMLRQPVRLRASGRTDAGVHALGQVVNFHARTRLTPNDLQRGLNSLLPDDIVVLEVREVPHSFHACFSASSKVYEYHILNRPVPSALQRQRCWHIRQQLDMKAMRSCLPSIIGEHDFTSFMASGSSVRSKVRTLHRAEIYYRKPDHLVMEFEANGFLRHMVRNMVGSLVEVGRGKQSIEEFNAVLQARDRRQAGMTAPAHGLYLVRVRYPGID